MRKKFYTITFFICAFVTIFIVLAIVSQMLESDNLSSSSTTLQLNKSELSIKYVLIWAHQIEPLLQLGRRSSAFHRRNCLFTNCYITWDRSYFRDTSRFDAIIYHGRDLARKDPWIFLPKNRSPKQSYIFASLESSQNYRPVDARFNNVFNFTWTYKLKSDIQFPYIAIRNQDGKVIGPNVTIPWISVNNMLPVNKNIKRKLANKSIAAAWFVSNCWSNTKREGIIYKVNKELKRYNMTTDIYGTCGNKKCPRSSMEKCLQMLQKDYYFYFAFENSFGEDYVTEKLLYGLQYYAVPIVYGGANYRRFMPDGIYLNAKEMDVVTLVNRMVRIIKDKEEYYSFFKWHNHYSYHDPEKKPDTDPFLFILFFHE